jgi:hypothetical protein
MRSRTAGRSHFLDLGRESIVRKICREIGTGNFVQRNSTVKNRESLGRILRYNTFSRRKESFCRIGKVSLGCFSPCLKKIPS